MRSHGSDQKISPRFIVRGICFAEPLARRQMTTSQDAELFLKQLRGWSSGLPSEIRFWTQWIETGGGHWPDDFKARLDPSTPLREYVANVINLSGKSSIRILDVGSGPVTNLGYILPGAELEIVPVDPLSIVYWRFSLHATSDRPSKRDSRQQKICLASLMKSRSIL